ncbi:hypothetical protein P8452_41400 [Trifolium repens]|nr:hypothetical protein P8452_41400 [Trifolium repens]
MLLNISEIYNCFHLIIVVARDLDFFCDSNHELEHISTPYSDTTSESTGCNQSPLFSNIIVLYFQSITTKRKTKTVSETKQQEIEEEETEADRTHHRRNPQSGRNCPSPPPTTLSLSRGDSTGDTYDYLLHFIPL